MKTTPSYFKPASEIIQLLTLLNAKSAGKGRPCPVAALVVARLEGTV